MSRVVDGPGAGESQLGRPSSVPTGCSTRWRPGRSWLHLLASSEAMLAGMAFGLDPAMILEVVNGSSGRSGSTQTKWPDYVLTGTYDAGFTMELMVKDMRIALDLARQTGVPARLGGLAVEMWAQALSSLPAGADHTEIVRWLEQSNAAGSAVAESGAAESPAAESGAAESGAAAGAHLR